MQVQPDFLVIDTEGKNELSEIAIIGSQGQLVYEAFNKEHPRNEERAIKVKPLREIVADFLSLSQGKLLVFHNAEHDIRVLKKSFRKAGIIWKKPQFQCSYKLARYHFPNLSSYSLEYLSKYLNLKANNKYFDGYLAHTARYDAEFTYHVYSKILEQRKIMNQAATDILLKILQAKPNPFSSIKVATPFQDYADSKKVYQSEFETLKLAITDIKQDKNHPSKGAIVVGEPGSGKTHLMMRLAKELLKVNRLLYIRQPTNPDAVLYHTYSRILESFVEKIPGTNYTQLEYLLAHSFVKLISSTTIMSLTNKDREILEAGKDNKLNLYEALGAEGSKKKLEYWQHIEKRTNEWWINQYGAAGYAAHIIKGIVKYCGYSDPLRKELVTRWLSADELTQDEADKIGLANWNEEMSREAFSLEAISVFSKLSLLDEPLIIIFDQLEGLGNKYHEELLTKFGESVKEIFTHIPNSLIILNLFPNRWQQFREFFDGAFVDVVSQYEVHLQTPSKDKLKEILDLKLKEIFSPKEIADLKAQAVDVNIDTLFNPVELEDILNRNPIRNVLKRASEYYLYKVKGILLLDIPPDIPETIVDNKVQAKLQKLEDELAELKRNPGGSELSDTVREILQDLENKFAKLEQRVHTLEGYPSHPVTTPPPPPPPPPDPVIEYLQDQIILIEQEYSKNQIIADSDDIGKLRTIAEEFKNIKDLEIDCLQLGKKKLPDHLVISNQSQSFAIGFLNANANSFTPRIQNFNDLTIRHEQTKFHLLRDERQPEIKAKVGKGEIEKLKNTANGEFIIMDKANRMSFELMYKMITDIQNRDLEVEIEDALPSLMSFLKDYWLINLFEQF